MNSANLSRGYRIPSITPSAFLARTSYIPGSLEPIDATLQDIRNNLRTITGIITIDAVQDSVAKAFSAHRHSLPRILGTLHSQRIDDDDILEMAYDSFRRTVLDSLCGHSPPGLTTQAFLARYNEHIRLLGSN